MMVKNSILIFCLLSWGIVTRAQDSTLNKSRKIGGFVTASAGWDHSEFKHNPYGNTWPISYGLSFEEEINKIIFETGFLHSIFIGRWIPDSIDTDYSTGPKPSGINNAPLYESSKREYSRSPQ